VALVSTEVMVLVPTGIAPMEVRMVRRKVARTNFIVTLSEGWIVNWYGELESRVEVEVL